MLTALVAGTPGGDALQDPGSPRGDARISAHEIKTITHLPSTQPHSRCSTTQGPATWRPGPPARLPSRDPPRRLSRSGRYAASAPPTGNPCLTSSPDTGDVAVGTAMAAGRRRRARGRARAGEGAPRPILGNTRPGRRAEGAGPAGTPPPSQYILRIIDSSTWSLFTSLWTHRLVLLCIDAHCLGYCLHIFWALPGDVLAAPESALGLDSCNTSLSLSHTLG